MLNANDIMTKDVITIKPEANIEELARLLMKNKISGVPVVDANNRMIGIVTENDLIQKNKRLHIPTVMRLFGEGTLQRLTFVWLMITIHAGIYLVYTFDVYSNITIGLSIALGIWAFLVSIKLLKKEFQLTDARSIFWKINAAFLGIIVLLSIDEYIKHHL